MRKQIRFRLLAARVQLLFGGFHTVLGYSNSPVGYLALKMFVSVSLFNPPLLCYLIIVVLLQSFEPLFR